MRAPPIIWAVMASALILAASPMRACAQANPAPPPPARIGPEANGKDYQPTQAQVMAREKTAGIAPPPAVAASEDHDLQAIDRMLLDQEHAGPPSPPRLTP